MIFLVNFKKKSSILSSKPLRFYQGFKILKNPCFYTNSFKAKNLNSLIYRRRKEISNWLFTVRFFCVFIDLHNQ